MADYISREAIKNAMLRYGFKAPDMTVTEFVEDELTAADVEPVRHGRWIVPPPPDAYTYCKVVCSECHKVAGKHKTVYCPNCGAKMDLEDETNDD